MASVTILLKKEKANKAGEAPLYLRLIRDRKTQYIALGLRIRPADWNEELRRVKKSHPNSTRVNLFLAQKAAEAEALSLDLEMQPEPVALKGLKKALSAQSSESFLQYFTRYLAALERAGKMGTLDKASAVYSKLRTYLGTKDLLFDEMTVSFLRRYERYLGDERGNTVNTIHSNLKIFRKLVNDAIQEDLITPAMNPFLKFKLRLEKTTKTYLSEEELEKLWQLPLPEASNLFHHRNLFVFATYAGGIRISDLLQLKWANFSGSHVRLVMQKTGEPVSIKLPNRALEILQLYRQTGANSSDFIFPFLKAGRDYTQPRVLFRAIASATAYANKDLKLIAKRAEVETLISFHSSRHTFATRALTKGMPIEYVSKLLGHSSIKTTQIYAKIVNTKLDQAMDVFND
ncbi:site-specific integrase [Hymenobacter sp. BT683]|uniref:Site-specific integrase n=1 Tax=Hymenobacter jeongseonensis TaxID=2791027 RepID=A0ABS0INT4_9BACT|nr:site-specific integrase [Hymenobacter jeongseonensis]MBF9239543.1 site-specific integrase [Hymenobacter jeongseonensis]